VHAERASPSDHRRCVKNWWLAWKSERISENFTLSSLLV